MACAVLYPCVMPAAHRRVPVDTGGSLGRFILGRRLGAGGMGAVYEAHVEGRPVAIKVPYCETLTNAATMRHFRDEAIAGSIVEHPNVVRVYEHGEDNGIPFLVMEQVMGNRLLTRESACSLRRAATIVGQLLDGLAALHVAGIVHADVKSDNVLVGVDADGHELVKLIDFGLAHPDLEGRRVSVHAQYVVSGTPEYMAPEVIRGEGSTAASDIYSAGVILYELVTGTAPFAGGSSSEILHRHLREPVLPPSLRRPDREIPPILERIILRALEKDSSQRFTSASAFASALAVAVPSLCDVETPIATPSADHDTHVQRTARGTPRARR